MLLLFRYLLNFSHSFLSLLEEKTLISDADVDCRLVIILRLEDALRVFGFHANLWEGIVVDACCHNLTIGPLCRLVVHRRIVVLVMTEHVHLLVLRAKLANL